LVVLVGLTTLEMSVILFSLKRSLLRTLRGELLEEVRLCLFLALGVATEAKASAAFFMRAVMRVDARIGWLSALGAMSMMYLCMKMEVMELVVASGWCSIAVMTM
jgi:hypothetical protein